MFGVVIMDNFKDTCVFIQDKNPFNATTRAASDDLREMKNSQDTNVFIRDFDRINVKLAKRLLDAKITLINIKKLIYKKQKRRFFYVLSKDVSKDTVDQML